MSLAVPAPLRLQHLASTDSTNRVAMDAARAGAPGGLVVLADEQSAGRGRQGRAWLGGPHSLLVSVMLRPTVPLSSAWAFSFVAGLAALDVAEAAHTDGAWLKWPNDVWLGERKAGGVLCEVSSQAGQLSAVVLGIGLNLTPPIAGWPDELADRATALSEHGAGLTRDHALRVVCDGVLAWGALLASSGTAGLIDAVQRAAAPMIGRRVHAELRGRTVAATVARIGQNGALRLTTDAGESIDMLAGDVHLSVAAPSPPEP